MMQNTGTSNILRVKIGGQAGQGVKTSGLLLAKLATRSGYHIYNYIEYPSLIRGGHNVMQVNISEQEITAPSTKTDFLVALNQDTLDKHINEMTSGSGILYDTDDKLSTSNVRSDIMVFQIPLSKLAQEAGGKELLSNTVALGAVAAIFGADLKILIDLLTEEYGSKGAEVLKSDTTAAELGYKYITQNYPTYLKDSLKPLDNRQPKMVINGDEAVALAAISAGLQFAAIYPMSPISHIIDVLAIHQNKYGYIYKQPEDEIAAINMAIGASFAGARSMVATSGGGFNLMAEGYGLAGMTETPVVIIEGMRGAPATGLPTWSEQGDLRFMLHAHQGEFPRIVLAPGDLTETFYLTMEAFYIADKYQTPVVVLIDKNICDNDQSVPIFDVSSYQIDRGNFSTKYADGYKRYEPTADGISMRSVPGSGNFFIANSDEHDEIGFSSEEAENRNVQMKKRMSKLDTCAKNDMPLPQLYGPKEADITIVSWGSNKGSILRAMKQFDNVNYLHITWMSPFPEEEIKKILTNARYIIDIECNYTAQLAGLIREKTGIEIKDKFLKYNGRPFFVEEISQKIEAVLKENKHD